MPLFPSTKHGIFFAGSLHISCNASYLIFLFVSVFTDTLTFRESDYLAEALFMSKVSLSVDLAHELIQ